MQWEKLWEGYLYGFLCDIKSLVLILSGNYWKISVNMFI